MNLKDLFPNLTDNNPHATPDAIAGSDYGEVVQFMKRIHQQGADGAMP